MTSLGHFETTSLSLEWRAKERLLAVTLPADDDVFAFLNADKYATTAAANALKEIYRYSGEFIFEVRPPNKTILPTATVARAEVKAIVKKGRPQLPSAPSLMNRLCITRSCARYAPTL